MERFFAVIFLWINTEPTSLGLARYVGGIWGAIFSPRQGGGLDCRGPFIQEYVKIWIILSRIVELLTNWALLVLRKGVNAVFIYII